MKNFWRKLFYTFPAQDVLLPKEIKTKGLAGGNPVVSEPQVTVPGNVTKHSHIVLVEDNKDLLMVMKRTLGREFTLFTAENGREALAIIRREKIDLVVSDIMMPVMDGLELCRLLKNDPATYHIPVILLTAKINEADIVNGYDTGADGYLTKPFSFAVLQAKIRRTLQSSGQLLSLAEEKKVFEMQVLKPKNKYDEQFLDKIMDFIRENIDNPELSQQDLLNKMAVSKSTLYKRVKKLTGLNPSALITQVRLKTAYKTIEKNPYTSIMISELAFSVGFNDPKYFTLCFRKEYGITPSELIKKIQTSQVEA